MESSSFRRSSQKPIIFSFGQENNSQQILIQDDYVIGDRCKTKHQFIKKLIEKYERNPKKIQQKIKDSAQKEKAECSGKKQTSFQKPPLLPKPNEQQKQKKQEKLPIKEGFINSSCSKSQIKSELEKSHQQLLDKFKSPVQGDAKDSENSSESESMIKSEKPKKEVVGRQDEHKEKSGISTQNSESNGSIPLIESVLMSNKHSAGKSSKKEQIKESPIRELSEFRIPEAEMKEEEEKVEQEKQQESNQQNEQEASAGNTEQKLTIFWIAFILVLIVFLCYPTNQYPNLSNA